MQQGVVLDEAQPLDARDGDELLDRLATEFSNSGYDLRAALRWITLCSAFGLEAGPATRPGLFDNYAKDSSTPNYANISETIRKYANSGGGILLCLGPSAGEKPLDSLLVPRLLRRWRAPQPGTFFQVINPYDVDGPLLAGRRDDH